MMDLKDPIAAEIGAQVAVKYLEAERALYRDLLAEVIQPYGAYDIAVHATPGRSVTMDHLLELGRKIKEALK